MKITVSIVLILLLLAGIVPACSFAEAAQIDIVKVEIVAGERKTEGLAMNASYDYNMYLSLRSLAEALSETDRKFSIEYQYTEADGSFFKITTGKAYTPSQRQIDSPGKDSNGRELPLFLDLASYRIFVDGNERKYYTYKYTKPDDLFMSLTDIQLLFDIGAEFTGPSQITLHPERTFTCDLEGLRQEGYFEQMNSVLAGSAKDGSILFAANENTAVPVASTSKLMSYLIIADAMQSGKIKPDDKVVISQNAEKVSKSEDGQISMTAGDTAPVSELLEAMLVISSNEAAIALAEHVAGSESEFVKLMNEKAAELKLSDSVFYNCNGLPLMTFGTIPSKIQNRMSSKDMFVLTSEILNKHPEITDITSKQLVKIESFDYTSWNTNSLVFNNPDVTGLKTGSTKAAGSCVVACDKNGKIVIVFGAENSAMRGRAAEILFRAS